MAEEIINESGLNSYVFYESFYQGINELDKESQLKMFHAITRYGLYKEEPNFTGIYKSYWIQLKTSIDAAKKRYRTSVINGSNGGAPEGNKNAEKGKTCRKCTHRKSCNTVNMVDANYCQMFEIPKTTQNNPVQPDLTQNYLNVNDNVNVNKYKNDNIDDNSMQISKMLDGIWEGVNPA